jgi:hypothetical protein
VNDRTPPTVPDPEELAAAVSRITAEFDRLTQAFVQVGETIAATIEAVESLRKHPAALAASAGSEAWPFQPGDVVHDAGPDSDDAVWLHAAPVGTVVIDADGAEWKRLRLRWVRIDDTGIMTSRDLANRGPITVVSVGETSPTALANSVPLEAM